MCDIKQGLLIEQKEKAWLIIAQCNPRCKDLITRLDVLGYGIYVSQALYDDFVATYNDLTDVSNEDVFEALYKWNPSHPLLLTEIKVKTAVGLRIFEWAKHCKKYDLIYDGFFRK